MIKMIVGIAKVATQPAARMEATKVARRGKKAKGATKTKAGSKGWERWRSGHTKADF